MGLLYCTVSSPSMLAQIVNLTDLASFGYRPGCRLSSFIISTFFNSSMQMPLRVVYHKLGDDHILALLFQSIIHYNPVIRRCRVRHSDSVVK
jgi:hypothetical protein